MFKFCLVFVVFLCVKAQFDYDDLGDFDIQNIELDLKDNLKHSESDINHAIEEIEALDIKHEARDETAVIEEVYNSTSMTPGTEDEKVDERTEITPEIQTISSTEASIEVQTSPPTSNPEDGMTTTTEKPTTQHYMLGKKI